jgi:hypothetical protein
MEEITLEPAVLDRYVGFQRPTMENSDFTPSRAILTVQEVLGQPPFDLCPA